MSNIINGSPSTLNRSQKTKTAPAVLVPLYQAGKQTKLYI